MHSVSHSGGRRGILCCYGERFANVSAVRRYAMVLVGLWFEQA